MNLVVQRYPRKQLHVVLDNSDAGTMGSAKGMQGQTLRVDPIKNRVSTSYPAQAVKRALDALMVVAGRRATVSGQ
jgi:hypothetical protein